MAADVQPTMSEKQYNLHMCTTATGNPWLLLYNKGGRSPVRTEDGLFGAFLYKAAREIDIRKKYQNKSEWSFSP